MDVAADGNEHYVIGVDYGRLSGRAVVVRVRDTCTAGYKGIYQDDAYPSGEFLAALNPGFKDFVGSKLAHTIGRLGDAAEYLKADAAAWTGLREGIALALGNVDAYVTAPSARAVEPGYRTLHNYFGRGANEVMHRLKKVQRNATGPITSRPLTSAPLLTAGATA